MMFEDPRDGTPDHRSVDVSDFVPFDQRCHSMNQFAFSPIGVRGRQVLHEFQQFSAGRPRRSMRQGEKVQLRVIGSATFDRADLLDRLGLVNNNHLRKVSQYA